MKISESIAYILGLSGVVLLLSAIVVFLYRTVWVKLDLLGQLSVLGFLLMLSGLIVWGAGEEHVEKAVL